MIVPLKKATLYGCLKEKPEVLAGLQDLGCLHIVSLRSPAGEGKGGPTSRAREALNFLLSCPQKRHQVHDPGTFDVGQVEEKAQELRQRIHGLMDERDALRQRIEDLRPWGDFTYPAPEEMGKLRLWFYIVPHHVRRTLVVPERAWEIVGQDHRFAYIVVVAEDEPEGMPVARTHTGDRSLSELTERLEEAELELEDLQAERVSLTRWCALFSRTIYRLEDAACRLDAAGETLDRDEVFALQAWVPEDRLKDLRDYALGACLVLDVTDPDPDETPPTLLRNPAWIGAGQDLVSFYMTPGYWVWDPSDIVFFSFAFFFGMIIGDAGYGLLLGGGLALAWRRMGRSPAGRRLRTLFASLAASTAIWGVLLGNYFGIELKPGSFPARLRVLDLDNYMAMMKLVILIGAAHLILANAAYAWRKRRSLRALAPVGWVIIFLGAVTAWLASSATGYGAWKTGGFWAMGAGGLCVLFFTRSGGGFRARLLGGLHGLTSISAAFGDTLSYLRLFALLLATASLAATFNDLAAEVHKGMGSFGVLFALLILLVGHGLNLLLGVTGGFIHGLRLNFIEFFKWATPEEGYPFRAFERKETSAWKK